MILVLPADVSEERLGQAIAAAERLGWAAQVSRGSEQTIVALTGSGTAESLEAALDSDEIDVIPVLSAQQYRMRRTRRAVLTGLATGLALFTAGGAALPVLGFLRPPRGTLGDPDVLQGGSAKTLQPGEARNLLLRERVVILICLGTERYVALSGSCTYMRNCRLTWDPKRRLLVCPCHGDAYDTYGNAVLGPASIPLRSYSVERVGDELFVRRS